ncbi:hypothetical protein Btru_077788 [Bulinus truncatus]|nr:hypothetical protein Btru_077788 [Bulinus truncatus]
MESMERVSCQIERQHELLQPRVLQLRHGRFLPRRATPATACTSAGIEDVALFRGPPGSARPTPRQPPAGTSLYHSHGLSNNSLDRQVGSTGHHHRASSHYFSMSPNVVGGRGGSGRQRLPGGRRCTTSPSSPRPGWAWAHAWEPPVLPSLAPPPPHPAYPSPPLNCLPPQHPEDPVRQRRGRVSSLCGAGPVSPQGRRPACHRILTKNKPKDSQCATAVQPLRDATANHRQLALSGVGVWGGVAPLATAILRRRLL